MKTLAFILCILSLACSVDSRADEAPDTKRQSLSHITMQRTSCYGRCPIDSLTLSSNGTAVYSGKANVARLGRYTGELSPASFTRLLAWLEEQNFFAMKDEVGQGNIDASDLIVSVTRNQLPYTVVFRPTASPTLREKVESTISSAADAIVWKKDEAASRSGVRGQVLRSLTAREKMRLGDTTPPITSLSMSFAFVYVYPIGDPGASILTWCDQVGSFEFLLSPGRYQVSASDFNEAKRSRDPDGPLWLSSAEPITVEAGKFTEINLHFEDKKPPTAP